MKNYNLIIGLILFVCNLLLIWFAAPEIEIYIPEWIYPIIGFILILIVVLNFILWFRNHIFQTKK